MRVDIFNKAKRQLEFENLKKEGELLLLWHSLAVYVYPGTRGTALGCLDIRSY